jgi:hypothetical protein
MKIGTKIKQIIRTVLIEPLIEGKKNYLKIFKENKKRAIIILLCFIIFGISLFYISISSYIQTYSASFRTDITSNQILESEPHQQQTQLLPNSGAEEDLEIITQLLSDFVWPIFEDYIGNTPDPTGKSYCYIESEYRCSFSNGNTEIKFAKSDTSMKSAQQYSATLMMIVGPIFVLLCVIQGFNFITNENREEVKKLLTRFVVSIMLLILTPYLLSISIIAVNLLTNAIMGNVSISSLLNGVVESILRGVQQNDAAKSLMEGNILVYFLKGGALSQMFTFLCLAIPFALVLLLLIYICFQFIIRFLNLYFLTAIYPFVVIFNVYPKTQNIVNAYFKQWTTFIIQQPVFILGFKIVIDMLTQLSEKGGNSLQYLIIFIGFLLFLASINIFAARIWGDIYSAVSQNITAAVGAGGLMSAIKNPLSGLASKNPKNSGGSSGTGGGNSFSIFNVQKDGINTSPAISLGDTALPSTSGADDSTLKPKTANPKDNRSTITKTLDGAGYDVQANRDGSTSVSGMFYTNKNSDKELSTLYINKDDAINDGVIPQNVQSIGLKDLNILDTSNGKATNKYNNEVNQIAAASGVKAQDINIGQNSLDKKVFNSMNLAKNENLKRNIQGIGVKNDLVGGDRSNPIDNKIKIFAYKEVINNQINGTS